MEEATDSLCVFMLRTPKTVKTVTDVYSWLVSDLTVIYKVESFFSEVQHLNIYSALHMNQHLHSESQKSIESVS